MNGALVKLALHCMERDTPRIVKDAMIRMADNFSKPPVPIMSQEEFDNLPRFKKCILTCNMPGCGKVACTHGLLCVEHNKLYSSPG